MVSQRPARTNSTPGAIVHQPSMTPSSTPPPVDPRIQIARRVVLSMSGVIAVIFFVAAVFGAYHCATERPARELFFEPVDPKNE